MIVSGRISLMSVCHCQGKFTRRPHDSLFERAVVQGEHLFEVGASCQKCARVGAFHRTVPCIVLLC